MKTTTVEFPPQSFVLRQPAERTRPIGVNGAYSCEGQPFKMAHSERGQRRRRIETEDQNRNDVEECKKRGARQDEVGNRLIRSRNRDFLVDSPSRASRGLVPAL